ncbi:MAG: hypothetical protein ACRD1K_19525 [Acidimicrobiales bacterium]
MRTMVLAHGSGVDDLLALVLPLVLVGGLWLWSRRRRPDDDDDDGGSSSSPEGPK